MTIMDTYDKGLAIKSLVLLTLQEELTLNGEQLIHRVDDKIKKLQKERPGVDFVGWVGTTIFGVLNTFAMIGFITYSGPKPQSDDYWRLYPIQISKFGEKFLANVRAEAPHVIAFIENGSS
jgi:hypothetical protein